MLFHEGSYIQVDKTRCLNYQHNNVGCDHCVSHCPSQALFLNDYTINMDRSECLGCGLCFSDCPTEVFTAKGWDEKAVVETVKRQGEPTTQFFCEYHDSPYISKDKSGKGAVQLLTCLGSLSKGAWYEIGLYTSVELRLEKCNQCSLSRCIDRLHLAIETAVEWLKASGHSPSFSYVNTVDNIKVRKLKAVSTGLEVTSRRDLFISLFNRGKKIVHGSWSNEKPLPQVELQQTFLPEWQQRFEISFTSHFLEGGTPAYWPSIEKKSSCIQCGMCSKNCPTQALQIDIEEGNAIHTFTSGRCLDCRICMLFCPTESITRDRRLDARPFERKVIHELPVKKCENCEEPTLAYDAKVLCYWCRHEAHETELLTDVRSLLFEKAYSQTQSMLD